MFEAARKPNVQNASSYDISYVNKLLVKYNHDQARSPIEKSNDQPRDELRFQSRLVQKQRGNEVQLVIVTAHDLAASKRENSSKMINTVKKRHSGLSEVIYKPSLSID